VGFGAGRRAGAAGLDACAGPEPLGVGTRNCFPQGHFTVFPAAESGICSNFEQPGHFNFIDEHPKRFDSGNIALRTSQLVRESFRDVQDDNPIV
jgi:hypothetical protein